jgi:DNA-binding transcriptional LysR family regulator
MRQWSRPPADRSNTLLPLPDTWDVWGMELRHLRYFVAVAEAGHFGRAAARLGVAQPPLSVQIRDLEREVGAALFQRTARGAALSEAGAAFLPRAREALAAAAAASLAAREVAAGRAGHIVLGIMHGLALTALPRLLPLFRDACPGVALEVREVDVVTKDRALLDGELGASLSRPPTLHDTVATEVVGREGFVVAMPRTDRLARRRAVMPRELEGRDLVGFPTYPGAPGVSGSVAELLRRHRLTPRVTQPARTVQTAIGLVLAGAGLAILPASTACITLSGVVFRRLDDPGASPLETALCWRREAPPTQLAALRAAAAAALAEIPP